MSREREAGSEDPGAATAPALPQFAVAAAEADGRLSLLVTGDVDLATSGALERAVIDALARGPVLLDLSAVTFMDSSGIRVLGDVTRAAQADGVELRVADRFQPPVARLLDLTGMRRVLPIAPATS